MQEMLSKERVQLQEYLPVAAERAAVASVIVGVVVVAGEAVAVATGAIVVATAAVASCRLQLLEQPKIQQQLQWQLLELLQLGSSSSCGGCVFQELSLQEPLQLLQQAHLLE